MPKVVQLRIPVRLYARLARIAGHVDLAVEDLAVEMLRAGAELERDCAAPTGPARPRKPAVEFDVVWEGSIKDLSLTDIGNSNS
jgi:hypothetical protein